MTPTPADLARWCRGAEGRWRAEAKLALSGADRLWGVTAMRPERHAFLRYWDRCRNWSRELGERAREVEA